MDTIAEQYVRLTLAVGEHDPDYVDAYYGPPEWRPGEKPNLDFALVTVERALDLPRGSALSLFAIGRTIGWIAHAIEQYGQDAMIRPRAKYVGPKP